MTRAVSLVLTEWQTVSPDAADPLGRKLVGLSLAGDPVARDLAEKLAESGMLEVLELATGLRVRTTSYVGRVELGPLHLDIRPKIPSPALLALLRYAYGLRNLRLVGIVDLDPGQLVFPDLLIHQLVAEVSELISRGLHRKYIRQHEELATPRGRIDFASLARRARPASPALPCWHNPRVSDCLINQVLLAGLREAEILAQDDALRGRVRRFAGMLAEEVAPVRVDRETLRRVHLQMDRLTTSYRPALTLVEMLVSGCRLPAGPNPRHPRSAEFPHIPGYLFDMNRFFQVLVTRFLSENLAGYSVYPEFRVKGMLGYVPGYEALRGGIPEPRPDIVIVPLGSSPFSARERAAWEQPRTGLETSRGRTFAVLDVKYRDLWQNPLPPHMLYQVAMYALSQPEGRAAIIYPTISTDAWEVRLEVRDPVSGSRKAEVAVRPLNVNYLAELIQQPSTSFTAQHQREAYARYVAFSTER